MASPCLHSNGVTELERVCVRVCARLELEREGEASKGQVCSFALRAQKYFQKMNDSEGGVGGGEGGREWKWQMQGGGRGPLLGVVGALEGNIYIYIAEEKGIKGTLCYDCWCGLSVFAKQI